MSGLQRLHQEVGCSHPGLDRAEGMLDRLAPLTHLLRMLVEPTLHLCVLKTRFGNSGDEGRRARAQIRCGPCAGWRDGSERPC